MRENFLKYLQYEKRCSHHTVLSYENDLNQFSEFLDTHFGISTEAASHASIRAWIVNLVDKQLEPVSVNRKLACLRSYYKYLLRRGMITKDPTLKIRVLKSPKKLPQFVHENEMSRLLDHFDFMDDFEGSRDQLIMELLYSTGIRLAELINLKEVDISYTSRTIKVLGKRNKERVIPFTVALGSIMERYLKHKNFLGLINDEGTLLVTHKGEPCYPMLIYRTVKKYLNLFTTIEKRSPHVLRHTFATHLLNKGAELNAVKDLLGHTSLAATQVYTHNSLDKIKKVFDQAHPKA